MSVRPHPTKHRRFPGETWWYVDLGHGKKRQLIPFKGSYAEALAYERAIRQAPEDKIIVAPKIKEMIIPFLAWYQNEVAESTLEDINDTIDLYVIPWFGVLRPSQLTRTVIDNFKSDLLDKGLKPTTINKHLNYLSSILKWAVATDRCKPLGYSLPRFPRSKTKTEPKKPLTEKEIDAVYFNLQWPYTFLFLLMAEHGLRRDEAMNLKVADIDAGNSNFHVRGKGSKDRWLRFMSDRFEMELDRALMESRKRKYLIVNPYTQEPYRSMRSALYNAVKKAGITRHVNHHLLRHSFASNMAMRGMSPYALKELLGHASVETTLQVYTHIGKNWVGEEADKFRRKEPVVVRLRRVK